MKRGGVIDMISHLIFWC